MFEHLINIWPLCTKNPEFYYPHYVTFCHCGAETRLTSCSVLWCWRWLCVLSVARRWPPGRSSSLRTTRWATRWPEPASRTWGNTAAAPTPTCPEPEKPACPTCCSVWSLLCIEVITQKHISYWLLAELSVGDLSVHTSNLLTLIASCSSLMVTITRSHDLVKNRKKKKILNWMFEKSERIHLHMKVF